MVFIATFNNITVMVNNSTKYQQNGKTNPHLHSLETKKTTSYDVGYPGPSMGHTKHVAKLNRLMGLLPLKKTI
jgi:hypothetical protein